jgi:hypothetical protein
MSQAELPQNPNEVPEDELLEEGEGEEEDRQPSGAPAWFISVAVHALFALIFWAVVFAAREPETELPPMKVTTIDPPPKKEEKKELQRDIENKVDLNVAEADAVAPVNQLNVPVEEKTTSEEDTEAEMNKGREEAVASSEMGSTGAFMAIGAGGGSAGMFGSRNGGGKRRALAKGGGSRASESAVDAALRWFKRHQSPNGMWDVEKYPVNCTEAPKCEPGSAGDSGGSDANVAMTGYAVLCFLGAGYDHKTPNKYKTTVQKGLEYLRSVQKPDGLLGNRNYEHAVATMALAEAYAMTNDPDLKTPAQNGLKTVLARQSKDAKAADAQYSGLGWDYVEPKPERNDSSVSGWNVMALKSGLAGGLNVGNGMEGAKKWLERAWKAANKDWAKLSDPYTATSSFPYTWDATSDQVQIDAPGSENHDMAPVGALCAVFLGHHAGDIMLESLCNHIMKYQFPAAYPCNTYYMYYNTLAVFQAGGDRWTKWNNTVRDMLVNAQRKGEGCFDGSWNWEGTKFHGSAHGRILSTVYCCLCLEVYYRYKQVGAAPEPAKPAAK